jgi:hypothetical protein
MVYETIKRFLIFGKKEQIHFFKDFEYFQNPFFYLQIKKWVLEIFKKLPIAFFFSSSYNNKKKKKKYKILFSFFLLCLYDKFSERLFV